MVVAVAGDSHKYVGRVGLRDIVVCCKGSWRTLEPVIDFGGDGTPDDINGWRGACGGVSAVPSELNKRLGHKQCVIALDGCHDTRGAGDAGRVFWFGKVKHLDITNSQHTFTVVY